MNKSPLYVTAAKIHFLQQASATGHTTAWPAILNRTFKVQKVYWAGLEFHYFNKTFNMLRANELC